MRLQSQGREIRPPGLCDHKIEKTFFKNVFFFQNERLKKKNIADAKWKCDLVRQQKATPPTNFPRTTNHPPRRAGQGWAQANGKERKNEIFA